MEQLEKRMKRWPKKGQKNLRFALRKAATEVNAYAIRNKLHGPKMPRNVSGGFDGSTLHSKTGMRHRLAYRLHSAPSRVSVAVGTNLTNRGYSYPRAHEYGLGRMPERPWLRPSIIKKLPRTKELILDAWMDAYGD